MIIFISFNDGGWFKGCGLRIYLWRVSIYNVWTMACESGINQASFVFIMTAKVTQ